MWYIKLVSSRNHDIKGDFFNNREVMITMSKTNKRVSSLLAGILIFLLMTIAAMSGILCARFFATPYSNDILNYFNEGTLQEVSISKSKCNFLLLGSDKSGKLTDVIMLAQINPENDTVHVMSIPRDTRVKYRGSWMKINSVFSMGKNDAAGNEATILAVKELTGIPINHFIKINFSAFRNCIDELGGVEFNVPQRMRYTDPYQDLRINLQPGLQLLDGDKAEQLVRFRHYTNGDIDRIKVQQDFLHALVEQKLQLKNIGKVDDIYKIIAKDMDTSMTPGDAISAARQILEIGAGNINTITLPNTPQYIGDVSYVIPSTSEIANVRENIFGYDESGNSISVSNDDVEEETED